MRDLLNRRPAWLAAGLVAGMAVAAGGGVAWPTLSPHETIDGPRTAQGRPIPPGESHPGDALPATHPLLVRARSRAAEGGVQPAVASPTGESAGARTAAGVDHAAEPARLEADALALRQHCTWGRPGADPYRGTAAQALGAAQLPPDIVRRLADKIAAHDVTDRLTITNGSIRGQRTQLQFDPRRVAMTYGRTLCLHTRVNFVADHEEQADLYEVSDAAGRRFSVMVPEVCGNVSVLGERATAADDRPRRAGEVENTEVRHLFIDDADEMRHAMDVAMAGAEVPEPGTLLLFVTALGAVAGLSRRRRG